MSSAPLTEIRSDDIADERARSPLTTVNENRLRKGPFLSGVTLISFAVLLFQVVQTRVLSVIAWYYLAFFGISMAMLGMTVGAVYVYLRSERFGPEALAIELARHSLACAVSIPISLIVQLSLITTLSLSVTTLAAWTLLTIAMAVPYVFAGVVLSVALTRTDFAVSQVYGMDLLGAASGCLSVLLLLNLTDAPSAIVFAGAVAAIASWCFRSSSDFVGGAMSGWWTHPALCSALLFALVIVNSLTHVVRPLLVKDVVEKGGLANFEKWNSYSRIIAGRPVDEVPAMWGPSPKMPAYERPQVSLSIDGLAGTTMFHYDGNPQTIEFLQYDLVNLAYHLPNLRKAAIIGVGGGRDVLSAHRFGANEIVGVELNPIFINLHTRDPFYADFSNLRSLPNLRLEVDDARSWFARTSETFDIVQMSMIDTWAATGAGAFSLSENGLYTLEGWRAFFHSLKDDGIFTVSRWYSPGNIDETGRMISLAVATVLDGGATDARPHIFVAHGDKIATLVLSKPAFTPAQLRILERAVADLGFTVLVSPDHPAPSPLLDSIVGASSVADVDRVAADAYLDLSVPTDRKPFFFNQLKLSRLWTLWNEKKTRREGVMFGNLTATLALIMILAISAAAVCLTIVLPLQSAARGSGTALVVAGTAYFVLIGFGFMLAEISMLQYFSVFLGHPIYSLGICLFSLILSTGLGSLASGRFPIDRSGAMLLWGLLTGGYLLLLQGHLTDIFHATTAHPLLVRIAISVAILVPLGFLLGFAFPGGMRLVSAIDPAPAPWFWGINGATGVLASAAAVFISMNFGIDVTATIGGLCYLALIPVGLRLIRIGDRSEGALQRSDA